MTDDEFEKICLALDWQRLFDILKDGDPARKIFVSALIEVCHPDEIYRKSHGLAECWDKKLSNILVDHVTDQKDQVDILNFFAAYSMTEIFENTDIAIKIQDALRNYVLKNKLFLAELLVNQPLLDQPTIDQINSIFRLEITEDERIIIEANKNRWITVFLIRKLFDLNPGDCTMSPVSMTMEASAVTQAKFPAESSQSQLIFAGKKPEQIREYAAHLERLGITVKFVNHPNFFGNVSCIQLLCPLEAIIEKLELSVAEKSVQAISSEPAPDQPLLEELSFLREMSNP